MSNVTIKLTQDKVCKGSVRYSTPKEALNFMSVYVPNAHVAKLNEGPEGRGKDIWVTLSNEEPK